MAAEGAIGTTPHQNTTRILPLDFQPAGTQVICGRSSTLNHAGNQWCQQLVIAELTKYHKAGLSRKDKTELVTTVVSYIRARNRGGIGFVKLDPQSGRWHHLSASQARRKVLDIMQNILSTRQRKQSNDSLNLNFLDEYVSTRQTVARNSRPSTFAQRALVSNNEHRSAPLREDVELLSWPVVPRQAPQNLQHPTQTQIGTQLRGTELEDLSFRQFLRNFAASIPDNVGDTDNPFEPNPFPKEDCWSPNPR